ncbi:MULTISPECIES: DUF2804 domain-containing protein [unclassified Pseudomonas]|uniref:DUF2804 domain-containing protein n=1 Tax=unclassified Pseudomonas TaxID=196821 RepID=UPI00244CAA82|nr:MULTISPECIES: DUF2804 domain-containing protein [unclassified Pseudomonas]MDG9925335.1 DUF2804 domain-containing protein [Pseudomonas sp. GD04045]MDH0037325.1 DUF2804 domain-containing protein [Pseudomonas sp. GD04019]
MNSFTNPLAPLSQPLCDARGRLAEGAVGWSPRPRVHCALPGNRGRRKRWNHWCITTPDWMLALTFADLDYLGYGAAYFLDLHSGKSASHTQLRPFGLGCTLPDSPLDSHEFSHSHLQLRADDRGSSVRLTVVAPDIGGQPLQVALDIQRPPHLDSVNLVCPMGRRTFHATSRQLGLPVSGNLQLGKLQYLCTPGQSFASLDFARGVWPLNSHWTRAAFAAPGGIAGNFGSGWCDYSGLSENALWFGGELLHLEERVEITQGSPNSLEPWRLSSPSGQVDLCFTPRQLHQACPKFGPFYADTRQWFGRFDGLLRGPQGEKVPVSSAYGWLGATHARW